MASTARPFLVQENREAAEQIARMFETTNSAFELIGKTRETVAATRELLAEADRLLARR